VATARDLRDGAPADEIARAVVAAAGDGDRPTVGGAVDGDVAGAADVDGDRRRGDPGPEAVVPVFFLSDSTRIGAEGNALLIQFPDLHFERTLIPFIPMIERGPVRSVPSSRRRWPDR
jgi:hypothetical protein